MNKLLKMAGIGAVVVALALASASLVGAQGPQTDTPNNAWQRMHQAVAEALGITAEKYDEALNTARQRLADEGVEMGRWGSMMDEVAGRRGASGFGGNSLIDVAAQQLSLTRAELVAELGADKTVAQLAQARGIELQSIVDAYLELRSTALDTAVAQGRITQEDADERIAHMEEEALSHLQSTYPWECDDSECTDRMPLGGSRQGNVGADSGDGSTGAGLGSGMRGRGRR